MEKRIKEIYKQDCIIIAMAVVVLWSVLTYAILNVSKLSENGSMAAVVISVGIGVCILGTASSKAVLSHLNKNKEAIYTEDIEYGQKSMRKVVDDEIWKK